MMLASGPPTSEFEKSREPSEDVSLPCLCASGDSVGVFEGVDTYPTAQVPMCGLRASVVASVASGVPAKAADAVESHSSGAFPSGSEAQLGHWAMNFIAILRTFIGEAGLSCTGSRTRCAGAATALSLTCYGIFFLGACICVERCLFQQRSKQPPVLAHILPTGGCLR